MKSQYASFQEVNYFIHSSEKLAVSYILDHLDQPALALIVLRQITPGKVNYVIRQNYTTLPNTNIALDRSAVGLNRNYQRLHFIILYHHTYVSTTYPVL